MKKRVLSLALLLSAGVHVAFAQGRTVSGTVVDEQGEPVAGASIATTDNRMSTFTGEDGSFEMEIPDGAESSLVIEFGDLKQNVSASDDLSNIVLKRTSTTLEGVV